MATRQDENKGAKKDGRKWSFWKKENGEVNTLHAHNMSPVHASMKPTEDSSKIKVFQTLSVLIRRSAGCI